MKHGHVTGTKRERRPRQRTIDRYAALGAAIAQQLAGLTPDQLLALPGYPRLTHGPGALSEDDETDDELE